MGEEEWQLNIKNSDYSISSVQLLSAIPYLVRLSTANTCIWSTDLFKTCS